jgi:flagellin-like hook-associated protein FlgL
VSNSITINSNIPSLCAQRRLEENTHSLLTAYAHLSSGLRITKASDDAAGLALAASLNADTKVYTQGLRNLNDTASMLNVADAAMSQLSAILIRTRELAEQAANGTVSNAQRGAVGQEADALVEEYNRIVSTTSFNGQSLIKTTPTSYQTQAGYGSSGSIGFTLSGDLTLEEDSGFGVGDGTFKNVVSYVVGTDPALTKTGDFNGDGNIDVLAAPSADAKVSILLGNGNGTLRAPLSFTANFYPYAVDVGDVNNDNKLDIVVGDSSSINIFWVLTGNGNGTFAAAVSYAGGLPSTADIKLGDFDHDGSLDAATIGYTGKMTVMIGNGNGTFKGAATYTFQTLTYDGDIQVGDLNGDGRDDIIAASDYGTGARVYISNSDGTFKASTKYNSGAWTSDLDLNDYNGDGSLDFAMFTGTGNVVEIYTNQGNGAFSKQGSYACDGWFGDVVSGDLNGDDILDLVGADYYNKKVSVLFGNGNGTFKARVSFNQGQQTTELSLNDLNNDGALDIVSAATGTTGIGILLGNSVQLSVMEMMDLSTQNSALEAMDVIDAQLERVSSGLANVGAIQSRLSSAMRHVEQTSENYAAARSQIMDADIAYEAAQLVRGQILQKAAVAVLAQANQSPQLALKLLKTD